MRSRKLLALVILVLLIVGCYEMKQDEKGRTIKINKITGEVSVIDGDKILKLKDENDIKAEHEATKKLGDAKTLREIPLSIDGVANSRLITKWSDGNLYYQFFVDKNLRGKGSTFARLTIQLFDNAAFLIEQIPVPLSSMTGLLGADNKTIDSMEYKGQLPMGKDTYNKINEWDVIWSGFNK